VAVLSRLPVLGSSTLDLGKLPLDRARRVALVVQVETGSGPLTVVGTHMSHLTDGSPLQFLRLRRALPSATGPAVLVGDMNIWGPPLSHFLPGWRRAVRGRTWPAWRPLAQPDHILVTPAVGVVRGEVVRVGGSDHWPVRARLTLD
jgi:endonuclease/exonuclease/phosphatase family metal-dependent hydrolase